MVEIAVDDGQRRWTAVEPAFTTRHLRDLVDWFRQLADMDHDARDTFEAIEPNLKFEAERWNGVTCVRALFSHEYHPDECHPDWKASPTYEFSVFSVEFEPGPTALRQFADELERDLIPFPRRFPTDAESPQGGG